MLGRKSQGHSIHRSMHMWCLVGIPALLGGRGEGMWGSEEPKDLRLHPGHKMSHGEVKPD